MKQAYPGARIQYESGDLVRVLQPSAVTPTAFVVSHRGDVVSIIYHRDGEMVFAPEIPIVQATALVPDEESHLDEEKIKRWLEWAKIPWV